VRSTFQKKKKESEMENSIFLFVRTKTASHTHRSRLIANKHERNSRLDPVHFVLVNGSAKQLG